MLDECISVCGKVRKKDFLRDHSMKWNLCENWGYQTENVYHLFFECPCYDFERMYSRYGSASACNLKYVIMW